MQAVSSVSVVGKQKHNKKAVPWISGKVRLEGADEMMQMVG